LRNTSTEEEEEDKEKQKRRKYRMTGKYSNKNKKVAK